MSLVLKPLLVSWCPAGFQEMVSVKSREKKLRDNGHNGPPGSGNHTRGKGGGLHGYSLGCRIWCHEKSAEILSQVCKRSNMQVWVGQVGVEQLPAITPNPLPGYNWETCQTCLTHSNLSIWNNFSSLRHSISSHTKFLLINIVNTLGTVNADRSTEKDINLPSLLQIIDNIVDIFSSLMYHLL